MVRIKICGITNVDDGLLAAELGADALGFVFAESPRRVTPVMAGEVIERLPPLIAKVGVFANERKTVVSEIAAVCGLDVLQFHGDEPPEYCARFRGKVIKAIRVRGPESLAGLEAYAGAVDAFLLDAHVEGSLGGTGRTFDWDVAAKAKRYGPIILSGGLTPANVGEAVGRVRPYGVDVSTGVEERPGKKNGERMSMFCQKVREAERSFEDETA